MFKVKDDEIGKLYDLTSLSQQDSGIKPGQGHRETGTEAAGKASENTETPGTEEDNPFQTPVSMLPYRLARSILESGDRGEEEGTVRELLTNCVELLDAEKFPHIATSAHFLLSRALLPDYTDSAMPALRGRGWRVGWGRWTILNTLWRCRPFACLSLPSWTHLVFSLNCMRGLEFCKNI